MLWFSEGRAKKDIAVMAGVSRPRLWACQSNCPTTRTSAAFMPIDVAIDAVPPSYGSKIIWYSKLSILDDKCGNLYVSIR